MRDPLDAIRSLQKYVALVLPEFVVVPWPDLGDYDPPYAVVKRIGAVDTLGSARAYTLRMPAHVAAIAKLEDAEQDATSAWFDALALEARLIQAFRGPGVGAGRPIRVPLWDYSAASAEETSTARTANDYMAVTAFSTTPLPDPIEPRRVTVNVDVRLEWAVELDMHDVISKSGRPTKGDVPVDEVRVGWVPA